MDGLLGLRVWEAHVEKYGLPPFSRRSTAGELAASPFLNYLLSSRDEGLGLKVPHIFLRHLPNHNFLRQREANLDFQAFL